MCMWESRGAGFPQEKIYISRSSSLENNIQDAYVRALQICPTGVGLAFFWASRSRILKWYSKGWYFPPTNSPLPTDPTAADCRSAVEMKWRLCCITFAFLAFFLARTKMVPWTSVGVKDRPSLPS